MRLTTAPLVPRLRALSNQINLRIPFRLWDRTLCRGIVLSQEAIMIHLHRVDFAPATEVIRIDVFFSHDTPGDGSHPCLFGLPTKVSSALRTSDHATSPLNPRHRPPRPPGSLPG